LFYHKLGVGQIHTFLRNTIRLDKILSSAQNHGNIATLFLCLAYSTLHFRLAQLLHAFRALPAPINLVELLENPDPEPCSCGEARGVAESRCISLKDGVVFYCVIDCVEWYREGEQRPKDL